MSELLKRLLAHLFGFLSVGAGEDEPAPGGDDPPAEPEPAPGDDLDAGELDDEITPPARTEPTDKIADLERRLADAERRLQHAPAPSAPSRSGADPEFEREERQLQEARTKGATADQLSWLEWQIQSNRTMRASRAESQQALHEARDLSDKADFDRIAAEKPKVVARYRDQVDNIIANLKAAGQPLVPRRVILSTLIGNDMLTGKLKPATKSKPAEPAPSNVQRGRMPVNRSDTTGRPGAKTEREKRRERLEGIIL